jgi:Na+/H+-dicarboxylate symporter
MLCMVLGLVVGYLCNRMAPDVNAAKEIAGYFNLITDIFLRLIKMIIVPLVFATLVSGMASMGDAKAVGRIGIKSVGWFLAASLAWPAFPAVRWSSWPPSCRCSPCQKPDCC